MGKAWAIFFGVNMALCALLCAVAPSFGWGLPPGLSTHSESVDFLFYVILAITTFFFILTEAILVVFLWKYGSGAPQVHGEVTGLMKPLAQVFDTPHKIEMAWTIVPAAILLYIAFAQIGAWARVKYESRKAEYVGADKVAPVQVAVSARQFEWRVRYPSRERMEEWLKNPKANKDMASFANIPQADDVHTVNEVHIWKDHPMVVYLTTRDVLHSFNLPQFRVKQDALPGKVIPVWFTPLKANTVKGTDASGQVAWHDGGGQGADGKPKDQSLVWDIACAELCGWGHWRMVGRVYVHETQQDFLDWLAHAGQSAASRVAAK